jgi:hypothetical protein
MRQLMLKQLKCYETEDWGADECRLEVYIDGALQPYLKTSLNNKQVWTLNRTYTFKPVWTSSCGTKILPMLMTF